MKLRILFNKQDAGTVESDGKRVTFDGSQPEYLRTVAETAVQAAVEHDGIDPATITPDQVLTIIADRLGNNAAWVTEPVKMSADPPAHVGGNPDTALAGKDGKELQRLITDSQSAGARILTDLTRDALKGYRGTGPLFNASQVAKLTASLAAVRSTGDLLGRSRVRELADRAMQAGGISKFAADVPFSTFAEPVGIIDTPERAVDYFLSLFPSLGIDPQRYPDEQRRRAFTLAASTNQVLTEKVQQAIGQSLRDNKSVADATARITELLNQAGVSHRNPQYSEMVYRTNAHDAFQTGLYEEGRHADLAGVFPVWKYLGIRDGRQGADHEPKFDRHYPADATFADVRGNRPYNCRCSMQWVDFMDWEELQSKGVRVEHRW